MLRRWHALAVTLPRAAVRAATQALAALGATGLQEDVPPGVALRFKQPWEKGRAPRPPAVVVLRAWFADRPADSAIAIAVGGRAAEWTILAEDDWEETWKVHFQPVRISDRLVVAAPWHNVPGAVIIEPGNAFGTGEHITTRACLHAIDQLATPGGRLLDVGCGSGILTLAAAKLGMHAHGIDVDADAVRAAIGAATANDLDATFAATPVEAITGEWDVVVANLYAEVIAAMAPQLRRLARGHLVFAGILADRVHLVHGAMRGLTLISDDRADDWASLVYACEGS